MIAPKPLPLDQYLRERNAWSLLDMLRLLASDWSDLIRLLDSLTLKEESCRMTFVKAITMGPKEVILNPLRKINGICEAMGLNMSATYAIKLINCVEDSPMISELALRGGDKSAPLSHGVFSDEMKVLRERIDDELRTVEFFCLQPSMKSRLSNQYPFGERVANAFKSSIIDIEEAWKCFAFERYTACVFHLMRTMEVGLRCLGKSLNDPSLDPKSNPTWERILKRCDDELKKPYKDRSAEWQLNGQFYSEATANLRAVKDAWRNPSIHVEQNYDQSKANDVLNAVRVFMNHLCIGESSGFSACHESIVGLFA